MCRYSTDTIGLHLGGDVARYLSRYSTDTQPIVSVDTQPLSRPIFDRHLGRHSGELSTDSWSSVGWHVRQVGRQSVATTLRHYTTLQHLADTRPIMSADTRPTSRPALDQHSTRPTLSADISAEMLVNISADTRPTLDRHYWPTLDRHSTDTRPTLSGDTGPISQPILHQHFGRRSPKTRPKVSADTWQIANAHLVYL